MAGPAWPATFMLDVQIAPDPVLRALLEQHPRVRSVRQTAGDVRLTWDEGSHHRSIYVDNPEVGLAGLVELSDNNPLVCADIFSLPSAAATLGLIALGPLSEAGLIVERPTLLTNIPVSEEEIAPFLAAFGWPDGVTVASEQADLGGAVAATVICAVHTPGELDELDELFEDRYGRSLYVRRDDKSQWHVNLVLGQPHALYRLRIAPEKPCSLLTIQVMADANGKCGASQIVHAFNVMCGFEESLGIAPEKPKVADASST